MRTNAMNMCRTLVITLLLISLWSAAQSQAVVEDDAVNSHCSTQASMAMFAAILRDSGLTLGEASTLFRARFKERFGPEVAAGRMSARIFELRQTMAELALHEAYQHKLDPTASYHATRDSCRKQLMQALPAR